MATKYRDRLHTPKEGRSTGIAWIIYFLLYKVMRYRYTEVIQNLSRSFPEKSYGEIKNIAVHFYRHFSRLFPEMLLLMAIPVHRVKKRLLVRNGELLKIYHAQGRDIIIMLGHYGNWECVAMLPPFFGFDIYGVLKPLSNRFFDRLMKKIRSRFGLKMLPMEEAPRHLLQGQQRRGAYIFVSDQSPSQGGKHVVDFLNQPTQVITGAERLAKATDAVVVYAVINEMGCGRREIVFSLISDDPAANGPYEITNIFNARLEQDIRRSPAYWLWTHRRWKTNMYAI